MKQVWRKQKPRTPGCTRAYTMTTPLGDILEAEFNFHERLVRLTAEIKEEKGRIYLATVKKGVVTGEKDVSAGRAYPVFRKIWPFRESFAVIPDNDLVSAIGGCYEIFPPFDVEESEDRSRRWENGVGFPQSTRFDALFGIVRETMFQRWRRKQREVRLARGTVWQRFRLRFWADLHDFCVGLGLASLVYYFYYDYVLLGWSLACVGMLAGLLDFLVRKRSILFTKVLSFMSVGSYFFYNGYVYF